MRVKKDIFDNSYIGFIATNFLDSNDYSSQTYGVDYYFRTNKFLHNKNFFSRAYLVKTATPGIKEKNIAGKFDIHYPNDRIFAFALFRYIPENFNPEIGYVRRKGIKETKGAFRYMPRPSLPHVRQLLITPLHLEYFTDMSNKLLTRKLIFTPIGFNLKSDDAVTFNIHNTYEYLSEDFNIFRDTVIPRDTYSWWSYELEAESNTSRTISGNVTGSWGDFFGGKRAMIEAESTVKASKHYAFAANFVLNDMTFGNNHCTAREYGGKVYFNISTRLNSSTFIQWNNETHEVNMNLRVHYIPKIGSDFYFVYNQLWDESSHYKSIQYTNIIKLSYLWRF